MDARSQNKRARTPELSVSRSVVAWMVFGFRHNRG